MTFIHFIFFIISSLLYVFYCWMVTMILIFKWPLYKWINCMKCLQMKTCCGVFCSQQAGHILSIQRCKIFFIVSIRKWCFYGVFGIHVFWDFNWIKFKTFWLYVHHFYKGVHNTVKTSCWHFEICIFCNFSFIAKHRGIWDTDQKIGSLVPGETMHCLQWRVGYFNIVYLNVC